MALIGSFTKQPGESLPIDISYATVIGGRTTTSVTPVVTVPSGMTMSETQDYDVGTDTLQIYCAGGTTAVTYRWTVVCTIVIGGKDTIVEDEFDVVVLEV